MFAAKLLVIVVVLVLCAMVAEAANNLRDKVGDVRDKINGAVDKISDIKDRMIETMLPMRDGVKLHTFINLPKDWKDKKVPTLIDRSPYGVGDMEWIVDLFVPLGFAGVGQDMRGTEQSEGEFTMWQQDKDDSEDLGNWIIQQPWSDGRVFSIGASADGLASLQMPMNNPKFIAGQYIAWAPAAMYDILFPHGAYKQETTENWLYGLTMPNPDVVHSNVKTIYENEGFTAYWLGVTATEETVYKNVNFPSAFWGGWYDLFLTGTISAFEGYNTKSQENVRNTAVITIDPCGHCLEMQTFFTEDVVFGRTALILGQMLEVYGVHPVVRNGIKNVTFYVMSSNDDAGKEAGQYWTSLTEFPTPKMTDFYLHSDRSISLLPPTNLQANVSTSYVYDPANPVPTLGGNNLPDSIGGSIPCGALDQSEADARADVLTFQTPVQSIELAMTGPLFATLYVGSDAIDTDFTVKISDVYPTGEAKLIQDNAFRMRWREDVREASTQTPVYMKKGEVYKIELNLWNTSFVLAKGHALRVSVSSSNWPRFAPNPNNGILLKDANYPGPNITSTNTLFHSAKYPSKITLPIVEKHAQLPQIHVLKEMQSAYPQMDDSLLFKATKAFNKMAQMKGRN